MKKKIKYFVLFLSVAVIVVPSQVNAQLNFTVNSLADDEYSYAYDDPNTPVDESTDGICQDEKGRCTLRAAIDESINMGLDLSLLFDVSGAINLTDILYPEDGSIINGEGKILLTGASCFELNDRTVISGITFDNCFEPIIVDGDHNKVGGVLGGNVFTNNYIAVELDGDSNSVASNYFGIDEDKITGPNQIAIIVTGSKNSIGLGSNNFANTICLSAIAGIEIADGSENKIWNNYIGTTDIGDKGLGNSQGITVIGSDANEIGGESPSQGNVISGNSIAGVSISGAPPDSYSAFTIVQNNTIGLDPAQTFAIPNGDGVVITNGVNTGSIGYNVIAGNTKDAIRIFGYDDSSKVSLYGINGNLIGINPSGNIIPNGSNGIDISGNVESVFIKEINANDPANKIIGNQGMGILVSSEFGYSPKQIEMRKNIIYQNKTNNLLVSSQSNNGILPPYDLLLISNTLAGKDDNPGATIDIYKADINESYASAYQWLGSTTVGTDSIFSFELTDPTIEAVSLTATTSLGNTSGLGFLELITDVEKSENIIPTKFSLYQNYPNPFNPSTRIAYSIPKACFISLKVYDVLGKEVSTLVNEYTTAGNHEIEYNASGLSNGIYFYRLEAANYQETKKLIVLK